LFPSDINEAQVEKYFQMDDLFFALVLRRSMNVPLFSLPDDFTPTYAGVLVAQQGQVEWTRWVEIRDSVATDKNNPYYLITDNQRLLLTVVDQNGAGSGEGEMKVFALTETNDWVLEGCYYFSSFYSSDPETDRDYFASSVAFSRQTKQPLDRCTKVHLIPRD
jgi:hypothetical protein